MKTKMITSATLILFIIGFSAFKTINYSKKNTSKVMILGSYHMNNPGLDVYNLESDDVLAPKRQKEMQELVNQLAKFKPTKIAIERRWLTKYDTLAQEKYQKYLEDKHELKRGEDEQIGFRLAKQLGHKRIYCIDVGGNFPWGEVMEYAQKNGQASSVGRKTATRWKKCLKEEQELLTKSKLSTYLKKMNQPEKLRSGHSFYMDMCKIGLGLGLSWELIWLPTGISAISAFLQT